MQGHPVLTRTRIHAGTWEGILSGLPLDAGAPALTVTHLEQVLAAPDVRPAEGAPGQWLVRVAIPAALLADGVQTFLIADKASGQTLASFAVVTGAALEDDLRAELDLLRAELDMLKRAFRRHCVETA